VISVKTVIKNKNKKKNKILNKINKQSKKMFKKIKKINIKKELNKLKKKVKNTDYNEELKNILHKIKISIKKYYYVLLMFLPLILIDIITRILGKKINFYGIGKLVPNLFSLIWIFMIIGVSLSIKNKKGKILYSIFFIISIILFLVNNIYYSMTDSFFSFNFKSYSPMFG